MILFVILCKVFCLPVSELQMKFSRLLECEQCFIFLYSRKRQQIKSTRERRAEKPSGTRAKKKYFSSLHPNISSCLSLICIIFLFRLEYVARSQSNQPPSDCSYEVSSAFLLLACRQNSIAYKLNYWVWSTPLMNGKRSIYVALTSLASPNEELSVLSTAAEQEIKHCNSQWGTKLIY